MLQDLLANARIRSLLFLIVLALPFFVVPLVSSLWDANEAFYVQTPREMLDRGDWLVPYFNGAPRLNKPPLSYWLVLILYKAFGVSLLWERLLLGLFGFGSVATVYLIGRRLYDESAALLSAGILATTFRLVMLSRRLLIDIVMLFCLVAFLFCVVAWRDSGKGKHLLAASLFLGLAFLTKGPVVLLALALVVPALIVDRRRRVSIRQLWGPAVLFALIASSWYVALGLRLGWSPVVDFFLKENLGRFSTLDYGPSRGLFYYAGVFAGDFFPWSVFFLAALSYCMVRRRIAKEDILLLSWIAGFLLFFSLSHNKQEYYILPVYPAAALWLAGRWCETPPPRWLVTAVSSLLLVAFAGLYLFSRMIFPDTRGLWVPVLLAVMVGLLLIARRLHLAVLFLALVFATGLSIYLPAFEVYKPVPAFARTIREQAGRRRFEAGYLNLASPSLVFYLNQPVFELYSLKEALTKLQSGTMVYMIVDAEDYVRLFNCLGHPPQIVDARPKLYTTARLFLEGLKSGGNNGNPWARPVYLITNQALQDKLPGHLDRRSGLQRER